MDNNTENKARKKVVVRRKAERITTQSRALSLLTVLIAARCSISYKAIKSKIGYTESEQSWRAFLGGNTNLPDRLAKKLSDFLRITIENTIGGERHHPLARDICLFRERLIKELNRDFVDLTGCDDQYELDRELLTALDLAWSRQIAEQVQERSHGFWFVIRYSTTAAKDLPIQYCVSLLSVNANAYVRLTGEPVKPVPIMTYLPHFTLRSGKYATEAGSEERIFRGHIIQSFEPKPVLNFIGTRDAESPPLFLMTLKFNGAKQHATEAHGLILTTNPNTVIAGPVGACHVPLSQEIQEATAGLSEAEFETDPEISRLYRKQRDQLERLVGSYSEAKLIETLGQHCPGNSLENIVRLLAKARNAAHSGEYAGYYFIPAN